MGQSRAGLKGDKAGWVTRYAQRMLIENGISEAVQFFHIDALSSMVGMKVDSTCN
jgi:hypothetical protein